MMFNRFSEVDNDVNRQLLPTAIRELWGCTIADFKNEDGTISNEGRSKIMKAIAVLGAKDERPPVCFNAKVTAVLDGRVPTDNIYILKSDFGGTYYMYGDEAPDAFLLHENRRVIGTKVTVIPIAYQLRDEELKDGEPPIMRYNVIVSHKGIARYWQQCANNFKILKGKIMEINGNECIVSSYGRRIHIPYNEFYDFMHEVQLGRKVRFIVTKVVEMDGVVKIYGNHSLVHRFYVEKLREFYNNGEGFKCTVERLMPFGAYLRYKDMVTVTLRNRDFSTDFSKVSDIYNNGDKMKVKMLGYGPHSDAIIFVEPLMKYNVEDPIDYHRFDVGDVIEDGVVRTITPYCAYVGFLRDGMRGRDVMCPIRFGREPIVGDKVNVKLKLISDDGNAKGEIVAYNDKTLDLSEFDLI